MKPRYLFSLGVVAAILAIVGLRSNASRSIELKDGILQKDQSGLEVSADLDSLRQFVFSHMNSSVRFELSGAYDRAVAAARAGSQSHVSGEIYAQAQAACGPEVGTNSVAQVACVQAYLDSHLNQPNTTPVNLPPAAEYNFAYAAPTWSPDLAGLGILTATILILGAFTSYIWQLFKARPQT